MLDTTTNTHELLGDLVMALASGRIRVVDLTQTLTPDFPQIALPPEMGQCWPFRIEEVSQYDDAAPQQRSFLPRAPDVAAWARAHRQRNDADRTPEWGRGGGR